MSVTSDFDDSIVGRRRERKEQGREENRGISLVCEGKDACPLDRLTDNRTTGVNRNIVTFPYVLKRSSIHHRERHTL